MSDKHIKILHYSFDPLEESPISENALRYDEASVPDISHWILQFKAPLSREMRTYFRKNIASNLTITSRNRPM